MLRHWSLYEAMMHSSYVSTRMQLWREIGRKGLDSLFVHVGLPLDVCKQQYKHMAPQHVKRLNEKLEEHARDHGLTDLKYWSFSFSHGFKVNITASDVVFAVTSLLEGLPSATGADDDAEGDDGVGGGGGGAAFWRATRALGMSQWDEMSAGLNRAMQTQRALMRQGGLAMANKAAIRTVGGIRYFSLLDHGSPADVVFFRHPLSLLRLALYLQDALRLVKKIERPLVLSGPSPDGDKGLALVVGVTGKPTTDDVGGGNHFAHSFRRAAEHVRARFKHDSFEASVLQVAEKDLGEFMEALSDIDAERVARERMQATQ
jgi:cell division control protein 45